MTGDCGGRLSGLTSEEAPRMKGSGEGSDRADGEGSDGADGGPLMGRMEGSDGEDGVVIRSETHYPEGRNSP